MNATLIYAIAILAVVCTTAGIILFRQKKYSLAAQEKITAAKASGLSEPVSLHPVINPNVCLGCATCINACPEGGILGLVNRRAQLVTPASCIGHGVCKDACPTGAIDLVFGSETRGVEIPALSSEFESSVAGIFIAGELGGMGLIKNAISQGQQAVAAAHARCKKLKLDGYDLIIVGAGPAGLSAALAAQQKKMRYLVLEQDTVGGTIAHYPRGKVVMTAPGNLPGIGKFQFREASKEALMEFWQSVLDKTQLNISTQQRVSDIKPMDQGFVVTTQTQQLKTKTVLLAMGRRGTPRKLDVPGENLPKVVYRLVDPEQYAGQHVLVVGGGDSALEAALAIAEQPNSHVTLSYRSDAFGRAKEKNRQGIDQAQAAGKITVYLSSNVIRINPDSVELDIHKQAKTLINHAVIVCAGGVLPTPFLKQVGIQVEEKYGVA